MAAFRFQVNLVGFGRRFHRLFNTGQRLRFESSYKRALAEEERHAAGTLSNWRKISLLIAIPSTLAIGYKTFFIDHEEHPDPANYVSYSHIHIRKKPFPWGDGDHSLFHNDHTNLGFEKTEEEEPEEVVVEPKKDHFITKFIVNYMMDDPEDNRKKKNEHMDIVRQRRDEFLERKRKQQYPPEPIDLDTALALSPRPMELGVDGY